MRVAAFDLGSNSFHLLVADASPARGVTPIETKKEMVRLGESALGEGYIPPDAMNPKVGPRPPAWVPGQSARL